MTTSELVRVDAVLGSVADDAWAERLRTAQTDVLRLNQAEAQKSRIRKTTTSGTEIALSLLRGARLSDGDVLAWDEQRRTAVIARVDLADVMVIDLAPLLSRPTEESMVACVQLGHALGNQHWSAVVKGLQVYVPVAVAQEVMDSVLRTHDFGHVTHTFVPGSAAAALLEPHEARRLFGAAHPHDEAQHERRA
ncbi:hypothetical protein ACFZAR_35540 [Streptomyces sp. NPDC008222]|uniref:hypothetical protein n=1 Tax=Streptomyces sp. NPDC008222 TaxID=3364820 RepID=UPI0036E04DC3